MNAFSGRRLLVLFFACQAAGICRAGERGADAFKPPPYQPLALAISNAVREPGSPLPQNPVLAALGRLDIDQTHNIRRFELITRLLRDPDKPDARYELSLDSFAALAPDKQQAALEKAAARAHEEADFQAGKFIEQFNAKRFEKRLGMARRRADRIFLDYGPYLSAENSGKMRNIVLQINEAVKAAEAAEEKKMAARLAETERALERDSAREPAGAAVEAVPLPIAALSDEEAAEEEDETGPIMNPRFELGLALNSRELFSDIKSRFKEPLRKAASAQDLREFWRLTRQAFYALKEDIRDDGLNTIKDHPLGPWARAKLEAYRDQTVMLYDWIKEIRDGIVWKGYHGVGDWGTNGFDGSAALRDDILAMVDRVEKDLSADEENKVKKAVQAAKAVERYKHLDNGAVVPPLLELIAFFKLRILDAKYNPDPNHMREVLERIEEGYAPEIPSARYLQRVWEGAVAKPGNIRAFRGKAFKWLFAGSVAAAAMGLVGLGIWALLTFLIALGAMTHHFITADRFLHLDDDFEYLDDPPNED